MSRLCLLLACVAVPVQAQRAVPLDTTWTLDGADVRIERPAYATSAAFEVRTDAAAVEAGAALRARRLTLSVRGARGLLHLTIDPRPFQAVLDAGRRGP